MTVYSFLNRLEVKIIKFIHRSMISFFNKQGTVVVDLFRNGLSKTLLCPANNTRFLPVLERLEMILLRLDKKSGFDSITHPDVFFAHDNHIFFGMLPMIHLSALELLRFYLYTCSITSTVSFIIFITSSSANLMSSSFKCNTLFAAFLIS